ncbi:DEAD/DEAH box helicase [Candidatus Woesearchaeota archaeon]|nr:DEAD/DEAH box helicase [Candidatus Woesearchaeota archaeon]MBW3021437.1 DEAD/DEAH box helicase [Candidatus Woesearchaeota archaeon]
MLKNFTPRLYQETIFSTCANYNTLVVLPTGLGKTNIFLMLAAQRLNQYPNSKIMLIGPTRPLIDQYFLVFMKHFNLPEDKMAIFTGHVPPEKRKDLWRTSQIIFSTPQGLENDILSNRIDLKDVSLIGFDEAHKSVGDYSTVFIAKQYTKLGRHPRILAMTASPGSDIEKITEVCQNLFIEKIEVRTDKDPDVKPYVKEIDVEWIKVDLPESFKKIQKFLEISFKSKLQEIEKYGHINKGQIKTYSKKDILGLQGHLQGEVARGDKNFETLKSISLLAEAMKVQHALELLETQGITALHEYMLKINNEAITSKVKATQNLAKDPNFRSACFLTRNMFDAGVEHPKLKKLKDLLSNQRNDTKIIIFNQYRDAATKIVDEINEIDGIDAKLFVGQMKKKGSGLSQKKQKEIMDEFRAGNFNVLVTTSVAEEGLDIPAVDIVIFYEPVPSAIRTVQRRGRTGRQDSGKVIVLMTDNTRDVAYKWSAHHKEKRMYRNLEVMKKRFTGYEKKKDENLNKFIEDHEDIKIFADYREKGSGVIKQLVETGVKLKLDKLDIGDYLCSSRVAVEFKTVPDFVDSIIDGRLLEQLKELRKNFERPVLIIEGEEDIFSARNIHPNAIRGMIATITISYGIPLIRTKNFRETAALLAVICKREQSDEQKDFHMHAQKSIYSLKNMQEYVVSALPNIGPALAKPLLKHFKSVKNIVNASEEELKQVELIGDKKAKKIREVIDSEWEE